MSCYSPLKGYRSVDVDRSTGKRGIVFTPQKGFKDLPMEVPCGKCIGCKIDRSKEWAVRCVQEASLHKENCFLTLTYAPEQMPSNGSLCPQTFTRFMKRLRKSVLPQKIRFFQCGEYGTRMERPHHHAIIFGWVPKDLKLWRKKGEVSLFRSELVEKLWPFGFVTVGQVTYESSAYIARYILKKVNGPDAEEHYNGKFPEYITMSRMPGIGKGWIEKYHNDVYRNDTLVYGLGRITKPPRFYDKYYQQIEPEHFKEIEAERRKREAESDYNSEYRLKVRKRIQEIKLKNQEREIH
ncbi:MAG: replication initiator protein [Microviridae sp.]|nr:MAG: replication initiator protein [Microviridae sp.]